MSRSQQLAVISLSVLVGAAGFGGCGTSDRGSAEKEVRVTFGRFEAAARASDAARMCSLTTTRLRAAFQRTKPRGCGPYYRSLWHRYGRYRRHVAIRTLTLDGDSAVVTDTAGRTTHFKNEDGEWRIDRVSQAAKRSGD